MKATSHFTMGHILYMALKKQGIELEKASFIYGNIAPDYNFSVLVAPHFTKTCEKRIMEYSADISNSPQNQGETLGIAYSKKMGLMCHYICDYFCLAHTKKFHGSLSEHRQYETALDNYVRKNCNKLLDDSYKPRILGGNSYKEISQNLMDFRLEYLDYSESFETELEYAFDACLSALLALVKMSFKLHQSAFSYWFDDKISSQRAYSNGLGYTFRVFHYKHRECDLGFLEDMFLEFFAVHE